MTPLLQTTLLYALVPVVFTVVGAAAGVYVPGMQKFRNHVLHLAAGVVFAVVAVNLLPEIQRRALVTDVVIGFALGIGTMLVMDSVLDRLRGEKELATASPPIDKSSDERAADDKPGTNAYPRISGFLLANKSRPAPAALELSLLAAVGIDFLLDGLLLGVGFAAGARIGVLLALAEAAEQLSVGLALAGELTHTGVRRERVLLIVSGLGSLVFVSATLGATVLSRLTGGAMEILLSFGLAALLYLVTQELLREAHEERETTTGTAMFFAGFLLFLVIGMTLD